MSTGPRDKAALIGILSAGLAMAAMPIGHPWVIVADETPQERQRRRKLSDEERDREREKRRLAALPARFRRTPDEVKQKLSAAEAKRQRRAERNRLIMERNK